MMERITYEDEQFCLTLSEDEFELFSDILGASRDYLVRRIDVNLIYNLEEESVDYLTSLVDLLNEIIEEIDDL